MLFGLDVNHVYCVRHVDKTLGAGRPWRWYENSNEQEKRLPCNDASETRRRVWIWRCRKLSSVLSCSRSQKSFLGESSAVMISLFLRVRKFRDEHYICCFTSYGGEWCGLETGRGDETTKRLQDFKLSMIFSACFFFLDLILIFSIV
jgi:hypothetical protein